MELRITTGTAKNKRLEAPQIEGFRAVQEVAKMALFSILDTKVEGANCLDLYAGSGNLGLEALSRGASWCDFVDASYESVLVIKRNVENCGFFDKSAVYVKEAPKFVSQSQTQYDIIFADPFYQDTSHVFLLKNMETVLKPNGIIAFYHGTNLDIQGLVGKTSLNIVNQRHFGNSTLTLLTQRAQGAK